MILDLIFSNTFGSKLPSMNLKIYDDSKNYVCQVINLPAQVAVPGLDNLVKVTIQGNDCLIKKDPIGGKYLFFPSESQISHEFLSNNNLYRDPQLNVDKTQKGFFEENRRVKAMKFKGVISSGFVIPINSLKFTDTDIPGIGWDNYDVGMEFNEINGIEICRKYFPKGKQKGSANTPKQNKVIHNIVESKFVPEHIDTVHLLKEISKINLDSIIAANVKLHGTSARYYMAPTKRPLSLIEKVSKFFGAKIQDEIYAFVCASRRCIKSVDAKELPNKAHWYDQDVWSKVGKEYFQGKLNHGEAVYCEIIGKDYLGAEIQPGYTYGLDKPKVYIYRISNINSQGIEIDLTYPQMKERAIQLGIDICPEFFCGKFSDFIQKYLYLDKPITDDRNKEEIIRDIFYKFILEKPSVLDQSVTEEGYVIRIDSFPKPHLYKIKSKKFCLYESGLNDKGQGNIEDEQSAI